MIAENYYIWPIKDEKNDKNMSKIATYLHKQSGERHELQRFKYPEYPIHYKPVK